MLYAVIIALWACVLLPMWLWRHDRIVEERRSVDRFANAMHHLSNRRAGDRREVVMPARHDEPVTVDGRPLTVAAARSRLAARRRRTMAVLAGLLFVIAGASLMGFAPVWAVAVPALLMLGFLVHLRRQVSQQRAVDRRRRQHATTQARRVARPAAPREYEVETVLPVTRPVAARTLDPAHGEASATTAGVGAEPAVAAADGFYDAQADDGTWEPVPVPLPTYVLAPKAPRSVRVIDLTAPGAWTSGHLDEDELAALEEERREQARLEAEEASQVRLERASGDSIVTGQVVIERRRAVGD
ncbi:MAG TPA: hypothetical protein VMI11_13510 [Actinomycetes bacterium]|nr:hypothetical protein [Actinomycetes bacterium]